MKKYKAKKKGLIKYLLLGFFIFPIFILARYSGILSEAPFFVLLLISPLGILAWFYIATSYSIENGVLKYKSGFLKGEVNIHNIKEIVKGKTLWSGIKPALSANGLIIRYNRFDEIYIAPENNDELVSDLLSINKSIKVIA